MAFDDRSVYIGSANVTDYGFDRYLELGVLISGPQSDNFRELADRLLESPSADEMSL
jgi:putative cardiolipin synthase